MNITIRAATPKFLGFFLFFLCSPLWATTYNLPAASESLIGQIQYLTAKANESVINIAVQHELGTNEIVDANPGLAPSRLLAEGTLLTIPTQFILPPVGREGIVVNLPEMRLYYYPGNGTVMTYGVGVGKIGKMIPITRTSVVRKVTNPVWIPTPAIRAFNEEQGIILPKVMPAGPDNPLGPYAIYLGVPTYLIHSTIYPDSIGRRASFGCIRMREGDIEQFFPSVSRGIPVTILNMPIKTDWQDDRLFMEAHPPLEEYRTTTDMLSGIANVIENNTRDQLVLIDWQMVAYLDDERDGVPHEIGMKLIN